MAITSPFPLAVQVLSRLKEHHNVLISGPPATGKSRLLQEVKRLFLAPSLPAHEPEAGIFLPDTAVPSAAEWLPSPERKNRQVFQTTFHQGSKYRDFLRGVVPKLADGGQQFEVSEGIMYRAALVGRAPDGAALLIIDEVNRGPAVQVFGESIVALEGDKRLDPDGNPSRTTQSFEILCDDGKLGDFALPHHLYVLAAMNQADTSVAALDVAFQRRFEPVRLMPEVSPLLEYFGLDSQVPIPETPSEPAHVYAAAVGAWQRVNTRLARGRGIEYQIGHGIFLEHSTVAPPQDSPESALRFVESPWHRIRAHVEEVFFGHVRGVAAVLNLQVDEALFAGELVASIVEDSPDLYTQLFRAYAEASS